MGTSLDGYPNAIGPLEVVILLLIVAIPVGAVLLVVHILSRRQKGWRDTS